MTSVSTVMTEDPLTVDADDWLDVARGLMVAGRLRHLPVLSAGRLCGILSARDLAGITRLHEIDAQQVMHFPVETLDPDDSIRVAAERLLAHRFSSLPVLRGGQLVGIVTTTDLVREACQLLGDQPVSRLMTSAPLIVVQPDQPVEMARLQMKSGHIRHLPVVEGDEVVGFVSDLDLLAAPEALTVRELLSEGFSFVPLEARATAAGMLLVRDRLDALPVVRSGSLAGVVSSFDFLRYLIS